MALKAFNTLVKLHKRRVDTLRREMLLIEEERKQLLTLSQKLEEEHRREMTLCAADPKFGGFFGAYSARVKARVADIALEVKRLDKDIEKKIEDMRAEYGEQKKYEIARDHAKKLAEEARHRLQQRFDEIGVQQYLKSREQLS